MFGSSLNPANMTATEMVFQRVTLLIFMSLVKMGLVDGCVCPAASVLFQFPSKVSADACCLNFSGSFFSHIHWSVFTNDTNIQTLDLSSCNISSVDISGMETSSFQNIYLGHNNLKDLPRGFLSDQPNLLELDLSWNQIQELPEGFLQESENLQRLYLKRNQLHTLPDSVLKKPSLQTLEVDGNPWECSCLLLEGLEGSRKINRTTELLDIIGNLTCVSPMHLAGRTLLSVNLTDVCRPAGLTALFITLPLLILSALILCCCCGRKKKRKEVSLGSSKKKAFTSSSNGQKHHKKQQTVTTEQNKDGLCSSEGILKNQLLLRPASNLLGSTRDIYEEVEIKLGSVESLPQEPSHCSSTEGKQGQQEPDGISKTELDNVSVTEVMKDSADREKAYMTQSTEYYSLVPGIELEDSDHGEYENVSLS